MSKKKAGSMKNAIYGGTHGNLAVATPVIDLTIPSKGELIEVMDLSVGQEIKEIKFFNDSIGAGATVQLFAVDKDGKNIEITKEQDVAQEGFIKIDNVDFYVGDNGPMVLYMVVNPQSIIADIVVPIDLKPAGSSSIANSFEIVFSNNNIPVGDVATAYPENVRPPHAQVAIEWKSADQKIAKVFPNGNIQAVGIGHVDITGTDTISGRSATKQFLVGRNTVGKLISFDIYMLSNGKNTVGFDIKTVNPSLKIDNFVPIKYRPDVSKIKWASSDKKVLTIGTDGSVKILTAGPVNISAEIDNVIKSISINVTANP